MHVIEDAFGLMTIDGAGYAHRGPEYAHRFWVIEQATGGASHFRPDGAGGFVSILPIAHPSYREHVRRSVNGLVGASISGLFDDLAGMAKRTVEDKAREVAQVVTGQKPAAPSAPPPRPPPVIVTRPPPLPVSTSTVTASPMVPPPLMTSTPPGGFMETVKQHKVPIAIGAAAIAVGAGLVLAKRKQGAK